MNTYSPTINIVQMMRNALNTLNYKLLDHAERVTFLVIELLKAENKYSEEEILEIAYITLLHDIGAFKTESLALLSNTDKALNFEMMNTDSHAVFSYLFLSYFTKFSDKTEALIYHHYTYPDLIKSNCKYPDIASKMFLADRVDVILRSSNTSDDEKIFKILENNVFSKDDVELLRKSQHEKGTLTSCSNGAFLGKVLMYFNENKANAELTASLVEMLCYTIDFRSSHTLTHTLATVEISQALAKIYNLSEEEQRKIYFGALLHDIGKISTSILVLEKDERLNEMEFQYMKDHVSLSESILRGNIDNDIVEIAIRHHEKINGEGYPYGHAGDELNISHRIVALSDIASALTGERSYKEPFPKEKVIDIITQMVDKNEICNDVARTFFYHYDTILADVRVKSKEIAAKYDALSEEYSILSNRDIENKKPE